MSSPINTKSRKKEYQKSMKSFLFYVHRAWGQKLVLAELYSETYCRNRIGSHAFTVSLADTWPKERAPILYISQISDSSHTHLPVWVYYMYYGYSSQVKEWIFWGFHEWGNLYCGDIIHLSKIQKPFSVWYHVVKVCIEWWYFLLKSS